MKRIKNTFIELSIKLSAFIVIGTLILIFIFIAKESLPIFTSPELHKETDLLRLFLPQQYNPGEGKVFLWQPISNIPKYSIIVLLLGTLKVTFVALLFAIPISIAAAIYTSEFAPNFIREFIKPVIELLAGFPSVVLGFFALMVLASWLQGLFGWTFRLNAITAGLAMGLAVIPIVYTITEDSLNAVPKIYRDGALALGADKWQTAYRVVLPAAFPGIFAACVLGLGRAIGETMIVLMASGNAAIMSGKLYYSVRTLSATIAAELAEVVVGSTHYSVLFFIGTFLFIVTFFVNLFGYWFVGRLKDKLEGKI
ncbi:MAG: phosphate ABC transporter permease subunit PstC [Elusimicrobia bacterium]|nr:phosphate ABC transporter permease subunit PstC [Candidatus Liberimonas magnetica]